MRGHASPVSAAAAGVNDSGYLLCLHLESGEAASVVDLAHQRAQRGRLVAHAVAARLVDSQGARGPAEPGQAAVPVLPAGEEE